MVYDTSYDCCYEATGIVKDSKTTKQVHTPLGHYSCYASIYRAIKPYKFADVTYRIYIPKENRAGLPYNLCDKVETKKVLRCLQKTADFSYKFSKATYKQGQFNNVSIDYTVLIVRVIGTPTQHIWVTSMLRALYEWPYNIAAKEACALQTKLKQVDGVDLTKVNWINLYLTIAAQLGSSDLHGVVSFKYQPTAKTYHEWKQKIAALDVNETIHNQITKFVRNPGKTTQIYDEETYNEGVESRASKYVAAYKDKLTWKK